MSSDDAQRTQRPTPDDIADAYLIYRASRDAFLLALRHHARVVLPQHDAVFIAAQELAPVVRVVYAVLLDYDTDRMVCQDCKAAVTQALQMGLITKRTDDDQHGITMQGAETLREWMEHVVALKDHHARYAELWDVVTDLHP